MNIQELFEKPRARIIVISVAVFLLLIATIIAIACFSAKRNDDGYTDPENDDEFVGAFAESTTAVSTATAPVINVPQIESIFKFDSNGDGTCRVVGITDKTVKEIQIPDESPDGELVVAIGNGAFKGCSLVEKIHIPAGVKKIGVGAFSGCSSLAVFSVDFSNVDFTASSGVLLSKDKSVLVCYPASRVGKTYMLSTSVKYISAYAFEEIIYLQKILYEGSASKYRSIEVGEGNEAFLALNVVCNYVGAK